MNNNSLDTYEREIKKLAFVRIGVTGHRKLENVRFLQESVQKVLFLIDDILKENLKNTPYGFHIISPLAEGADRLVVKEVMEWHASDSLDKPSLSVVLPLPKDDYIRDFESAAAKDEFEALLCRALSIYVLQEKLRLVTLLMRTQDIMQSTIVIF